MSMSACARGCFAAALVVWMAIEGGRAQTQDVAPVNSGANPYRAIRDWAQLTLEGRPWGGSTAWPSTGMARPCGRPIVARRGVTPGCLGTKANPVHHFDETGKEIRSFGSGMFVWAA